MVATGRAQRSSRRGLPACLAAGTLACVGWSLKSVWQTQGALLASVGSERASAVFSWLSWAPEPGSKMHKSLSEHYAGALPDIVVVERVKEALSLYGLSKKNTIYAESICADELCHEPHQLSDLLTTHWSNVFTMGGLGGLAHGGPVALGAFKGHVPDGGNMMILYGPHVGMEEDGTIGVVLRPGQHNDTVTCYSVIDVYNNCLKGATVDAYSPADKQMRLIHQELCPHVDKISKAEHPMAVLPRVAFDIIDKQIGEMTKGLDLGTGSLVLLGGIMINTPHKMQDQFLPLHFSIKKGRHKKSVDLLEHFDVASGLMM
eukprot:TRINITY_DN16532_c0_g2_i1.p1 TRINITY_DN16532_c0_g2~~TRINITY_DN16532_c0_g2_i1.p1  ORF type:complete len:317 (+),score=59.39 TRINITY_DN16532_c0_g2_i1:177-1127(+)